MSLRSFFDPKSVAIIGASGTPGKGGYALIENMTKTDFKRKVYPINPKRREILGLKTYPKINKLPEVVDLAIIVINNEAVPQMIDECGSFGIKNVIIESGGFAEASERGKELEKDVLRKARKFDMRVMGPNSIGMIDTSSGFSTPYVPIEAVKKGRVAFVGQTGLLESVFIPLIQNIGVSKVVCMGNKCDVDECDVLEYIIDDSSTDIIAMYIEGIRDGRRFIKIIERSEKVLIVLKGGRTTYGARAVSSHTGTICGENRVYDALFEQYNIIPVKSFEELFDLVKVFISQPFPNGNCVGIITVTGAGGVTASDCCEDNGLEIASVSSRTLEKIREVYPTWAPVKNPLDVWSAIEKTGSEEVYRRATEEFLADGGVDAVIPVIGAVSWMELDIRLFLHLKKKYPQKPIILVGLLGEPDILLRWKKILEPEIPVFPTAERAIKALALLEKFGRKSILKKNKMLRNPH
ncbi:MAG: succinyl-CoA synthetase subunit alpha [Candidatus Methanolliviera sp. GoM_oil]|nr:MAG: succinyl-CoA synthetase subunit alpha [Candidatus Methanolliviera sp. GoM_oil]